MNSQHSTTNIKQFVATTFAVNRVKMFLPVKVTVDSNDKKKVLNSKSSLNFNNFSELHSNGETTDANGNKYSLTNQYGITYSNCTHFELSLRANTNVFCIDIDDKNITFDNLPSFLHTLPYTLSSTKMLPHFYFQMSGIDNKLLKSKLKGLGSNNLNFCIGELLISHTWENATGNVYNWNLGELPTVPFDTIKNIIKNETVSIIMQALKKQPNLRLVQPKVTELIAEPEINTEDNQKNETIIRQLQLQWPADKLSTYCNWRDFTFVIQNTFPGDSGKVLWDEISQKYDGYDAINNNKAWSDMSKNRYNNTSKLSIGTLKFWTETGNDTDTDTVSSSISSVSDTEIDTEIDNETDLYNPLFTSGLIADYFVNLHKDK